MNKEKIKKLIKNKIIIFLIFGIIGYNIIPYFFNFEIKKIPTSKIIYDTQNIEIGEISNLNNQKHIEINNYPDFLKKIVINSEDKRFYFHSGIDYLSILRAFINNFKSNNTQGASTIESQIIKNNNLYFNNNQKRNYLTKIIEFLQAKNLDKKYSKNEILNVYLNNIPFESIYFGFSSASRYYYNKNINNTSKAEMIGLLTIIKNPSKYSPKSNYTNFKKRYDILTKNLYKNNLISKIEYEEIIGEKLNFKNDELGILPYIKDYYSKFKINGNNIYSTIDYNLTNNIDNIAKSSIKNLSWKNVGDYSIIIVDKKTMELKVMIGGINYDNKNGQVNGSLALRQPGSALKPLLYLKSFKELEKNPSSTILDLPIQFYTNDGNIYSPKNYSLNYSGEVSLAESLSQSLNIPAVKLLNELGIDKFISFLKQLGLTSINKSGDYYGLSLALGSAEVNLFELTQSYNVFFNDGKFCKIKIIKGEKNNCTEIIESKYTKMIEEILTNRYFKLKGFGINSNLDFEDKFVLVKTGTSRNYKDNWAIGYTNNYLIGVWTGNKSGEDMMGVSGVSGAGEIFRNIVYYLQKENYNPNIVDLEKEQKNYLEILSPLDKSIFKINNDIPIENQNISLELKTNINYDYLKWFLNGKIINDNKINLKELTKNNEIKIELYRNNTLILSQTSSIQLSK